jgi:hypothetical protein
MCHGHWYVHPLLFAAPARPLKTLGSAYKLGLRKLYAVYLVIDFMDAWNICLLASKYFVFNDDKQFNDFISSSLSGDEYSIFHQGRKQLVSIP